MTYLNPTQHKTNTLPGTIAASLIGWSRLCLRVLMRIPVAVVKAVIGVSGAIGNAAEMAYVDPFRSNGKDRK